MEENLRLVVKEILEEGHLMSLATVDDEGPWVSDVVYVNDDDLNIYWASYEDARHSQAISRNNKVAASITISLGVGDHNKGLQIQGIARSINTEIKEIADKHRKKRGQKALPQSDSLLDRFESWYELKPGYIDIIHEAYFGQHKKKLKMDAL
jgi:uncharacterized protein YhbP (UPF0306 family)